jgi:hypothetical protein
LRRVVLFGFQSSQFGDQADAPGLERPEAGTGTRILQFDQGLTDGDLVALLDEQSVHHAAFEMADGFSFRIDDDRAVGDRGAAELNRKPPGKKSPERHEDRGKPRNDETSQR